MIFKGDSQIFPAEAMSGRLFDPIFIDSLFKVSQNNWNENLSLWTDNCMNFDYELLRSLRHECFISAVIRCGAGPGTRSSL